MTQLQIGLIIGIPVFGLLVIIWWVSLTLRRVKQEEPKKTGDELLEELLLSRIDFWHKGEGQGMTLAKWLNMSPDDYAEWIANPTDKPVNFKDPMNPERAAFFLRRFKNEEKLLGPNEQAALDYTIKMLDNASLVSTDVSEIPAAIDKAKR